jgi:hypothetical protein
MAAAEITTPWDGPPLEAWRCWTPAECAARLAGCAARWYVVGGWAIDLWLGRETREHDDLEIAVAREDFRLIRAQLDAQGLSMHEASDGGVTRLAPGQTPDPAKYQVWVCDPAADVWRLDVMQQPSAPGMWCFRRDPSLSAPLDFMVAPGPIPHLKAHGVLLFKAKAARPKDEADLANAAPRLSRDERSWLTGALRRVHPGHAWIDRIERLAADAA